MRFFDFLDSQNLEFDFQDKLSRISTVPKVVLVTLRPPASFVKHCHFQSFAQHSVADDAAAQVPIKAGQVQSYSGHVAYLPAGLPAKMAVAYVGQLSRPRSPAEVGTAHVSSDPMQIQVIGNTSIQEASKL